MKLTLILLLTFITYTETVFAAPFAYVTNFQSNTVSVINVATRQIIATVNVGDGPADAVASVDGKFVYVVNGNSNNVSVIDVSSNQVVKTVGVDTGPVQIAASPDGTFVYVTNRLASSVTIIETATNNFVDTVPVGLQPTGIAFSNDSLSAYTVNITNSVTEINVSTMEVEQTIEMVGNEPLLIAVDPTENSSFAYVTSINGDALTEIDLADGMVSDTINLMTTSAGGEGGDLVFTPDGSTIYVSFGEVVTVVDIPTKQVTDNIEVIAECLGITPDGQEIYACVDDLVVGDNPSTVQIIDVSSNTVVGFVTVGIGAQGIAITPLSGTDTPDPGGTGSNNSSCALASASPGNISFPLYLLIPAFILVARIKRKYSARSCYIDQESQIGI